MISLHNGKSVGSAVHYFSADNYYSEQEGLENSEWFGKGAAKLELSGGVSRDEFRAVLDGKVGEQVLGKFVKNDRGETVREHRPYLDITFSAPKSVSIIAEIGGATEIRLAHESAVKDALDFMERRLAGARVERGGGTKFERTGNLSVALFRHNTSRELDPQTHTHAVVLNATQLGNGQWRSLTNDLFYEHQHTIGAIYMSRLACEMQKLGHEIAIKDKYGNFEIKGISDEQLVHFSQRRSQIIEALAARGIDIKDADAALREKATLMTRKSKVEVDHEQLLGEWKSRAQEVGIDIKAIESKAYEVRKARLHEVVDKDVNIDGAGTEQPGAKTVAKKAEPDLGLEALRFAAGHLHEREMVVPTKLLIRTAIQHSIGQASYKQIEATYNRLVTDGVLHETSDGSVTTNRLLRSEEWLVQRVHEGKGQLGSILSAEQTQTRIAQYEQQERIRTNNASFAFAPGQRDAVALALSAEDRFVAVQGDAGTGKTTMLQAVRVLAEEQGYHVRGMSVSGSATGTLEIETGIQSHTVKMFLINEQKAQHEAEAQRAAGKQPVERGRELWVVDESSFLGQRDMTHIMNYAEKVGARVVFTGDVRQLSSPEAGKPFELGQKEGMQAAQMTEIRRQKTEHLQSVVGDIVKQQNGRAFDKLLAAGNVREVQDKETLFKGVVDSYLRGDREKTLIITPFNRDKIAINAQVRKTLREQGMLKKTDYATSILINKGMTKAEMQHAKYYEKNDVILFRRGYKSLDIPDNSYVRVHSIDRDRNVLHVKFADGQERAFSPKGKASLEVYQSEARGIAKGDIVRITRSNKEMKAGDIGTVKSLRGGHITLESSRKSVTFDSNAYPHWEHGYAVTVHAAQGLTVDKTIFHIHAPDLKKDKDVDKKPLHELAKVFGERSFYVGVTRSRMEVEIHTNDGGLARKFICQEQSKSSSLEAVKQQEPERVRGGKER